MEGGAVGHNFVKDTPRDHLCQVWTLHRSFLPCLAPFGQRVSEEKIFLTLANQKKELILVAMLVGRMEPNEKVLQRILHRCFLPSFALFCIAVSEKKIFLNSSQSETRISLGGHICWWNGTKWRNFIENLTQMLTAKFGSIWPSCFRGED